jgi:hypothetical protein
VKAEFLPRGEKGLLTEMAPVDSSRRVDSRFREKAEIVKMEWVVTGVRDPMS